MPKNVHILDFQKIENGNDVIFRMTLKKQKYVKNNFCEDKSHTIKKNCKI